MPYKGIGRVVVTLFFYFESEFQSIPQSVAEVSLFIKCKAINI